MLTYPIVEILPLSEGIQSRGKSHFKRSLKFPKTQVQILEILPVVFQLLSRVLLFATAWTATHQASLSFSISWSLLKLMYIESVMPFNHLILCRPLLLLPSVFPSMRVFFNESALRIRWPKYWSFSFSSMKRQKAFLTHSYRDTPQCKSNKYRFIPGDLWLKGTDSFFFFYYLFIYLAVLRFCCGMHDTFFFLVAACEFSA